MNIGTMKPQWQCGAVLIVALSITPRRRSITSHHGVSRLTSHKHLAMFAHKGSASHQCVCALMILIVFCFDLSVYVLPFFAHVAQVSIHMPRPLSRPCTRA